MKPIEIAKEVFPGKPDDFISFVLWEHTGYPCFWSTSAEYPTPEAVCRKQLEDFRDGKCECLNCKPLGM